MSKRLLFGSDLRKKIKMGVDQVANAVKVSLGPKGRHVAYELRFGLPIVTNDGVSIAKQVDLKDNIENMAANLIKEVASKTNDVSGDGTTTATVLAQAIITKGIKNIEAGANPIYIKNGIELATKQIVEAVKSMTKVIKTKEEMQEIATISANDDAIGAFVAEAVNKVGEEGVISIEEGKKETTTIEMVEGLQFDRGLLSPYFINDSAKMVCRLENTLVLVIDQKIQSIQDILGVLESVVAAKHRLLIICQDMDNITLANLVTNKVKGTLDIAVVSAPGYGDRRKEQLGDIATIVGGVVIGEDTGHPLNQLTAEHLGKAKVIIAGKDSTTIVADKVNKPAIELKIKEITEQVKNTVSDFDIDQLMGRKAKLTGGVAVISVGDKTESAMQAKKFKIEDAIHATRAALKEGVVPGGGVTYLKIAIERPEGLHPEELVGFNMVIDAIKEPAKQIAHNAGKNPDVIVEKIVNSKEKSYGYNAKTEQFVDLLKEGIVDPTLTVRTALENASSIACLLLTTEAFIAIDKDDKTLET